MAAIKQVETESTFARWATYESANKRFQDILNDLDDQIVHAISCMNYSLENAADEDLTEAFRKQATDAMFERAKMAVQLYLMETDLDLTARYRFQRGEHFKMAMELTANYEERKAAERGAKAAAKKAAPRKRRAAALA